MIYFEAELIIDFHYHKVKLAFLKLTENLIQKIFINKSKCLTAKSMVVRLVLEKELIFLFFGNSIKFKIKNNSRKFYQLIYIDYFWNAIRHTETQTCSSGNL